MGEVINRCRGLAAAASLSVIAGLLAACANGPSGPAPVYLRGAEPVAVNGPPPPWHENKTVIVRRGQSLSDIAHANHVPEGALIAANNLRPPYRLHAGARLVIPDRTPPPVQQALAPPPVSPPLPPPPSQMTAVPPRPDPMPPPRMAAIAPAPPPPAKLPSDVVPLDPPPKPGAAAMPAPPAAVPPAVPPSPPPLAGEPTGGRFPWPVHGRILAAYGATTGGARNEGINIAAPRGAPVRAIDSGLVAYVGNEVKGYGNLILIKHANGWISAYAHLDDIMVKKGDAVGAGQIIAKVGDSGGVGEPQLHFELRRGKKPVDPKEFLEPASSAAGRAGQDAG